MVKGHLKVMKFLSYNAKSTSNNGAKKLKTIFSTTIY